MRILVGWNIINKRSLTYWITESTFMLIVCDLLRIFAPK